MVWLLSCDKQADPANINAKRTREMFRRGGFIRTFLRDGMMIKGSMMVYATQTFMADSLHEAAKRLQWPPLHQ